MELRAFIRATDHVPYENRPGSGVFAFGTHQRATDDDATQRAHVVEQILDRVLPRWRGEPESPKAPKWEHLRGWTSRAIAALEREAELAEKLGDGSPQMSAGALHPWVWAPARDLWLGAHFRAALHAAATSLVGQTQAKTGRLDVADKALFQEVLGLNPATPEKPKLRVLPDDGSPTYRSAQEGAMHLGVGLYQGVRNVTAHGVAELEEQIALERLAAFSVLARWVDESTLVTG